MRAKWILKTPEQWSLEGKVGFEDAPRLAADFQPLAQTSYSFHLARAQGGTPLLLVLLACCRQAEAVNADLQFDQASESLKRLIDLSDLSGLLPFSTPRKQ